MAALFSNQNLCKVINAYSASRIRRPISWVPMGVTPGSAMSGGAPALGQDRVHGLLHRVGLGGEVEGVAEHHGHGQDGGDGVGLVLAAMSGAEPWMGSNRPGR